MMQSYHLLYWDAQVELQQFTFTMFTYLECGELLPNDWLIRLCASAQINVYPMKWPASLHGTCCSSSLCCAGLAFCRYKVIILCFKLSDHACSPFVVIY